MQDVVTYCLITKQVRLPKSLKQVVLGLVELGWLFRKVQKYCESPKSESTCGLAARAFAAALQEELSKNKIFISAVL